MVNKISRAIMLVAVFVVTLSLIVCLGVFYEYFEDVEIRRQKEELSFITSGYESLGLNFFENQDIKSYRITLIDKDGTVLFDNEFAKENMENHLSREEIAEAAASGYGESSRYSKTLSEVTVYSARKLSDDKFLRISTTKLSILSLVLGLSHSILMIFVLTLILAIFLAKRLSKKIVEPFNTLNLNEPMKNDVYDELSPLLVRLQKQNNRINEQINSLSQKNGEITYITENVSDGIILLNGKGTILSLNKKAEELFKCKTKGSYFEICKELSFIDAVESALHGEQASCKLKIDEKIYRLSANTIKLPHDEFGVFLFVYDITDDEKAQLMRREFSANVSHELKTPLTAIMGSAELIKSSIAKTEDVPYFAEKIYSESQRLLTLIDDIIKLSRLDEGNFDESIKRISPDEICCEVVSELSDKAGERKITLNLNCQPIVIDGVSHIVREMIFNICDNAIIYNKNGGSVNISTGYENDMPTVTISDTGIGISNEDKDRIFERFYRVDKSRSKETGGTGLGLSIVKNGAQLHKAKISLESVNNLGTTIKITFPKCS